MTFKNERGNAMILVLGGLVVVSLGVAAYLSGFIPAGSATAESVQELAQSETAAGENKSEETAQTQASSLENKPEVGMVVEPGNPVVAKIGDKEVTRLDVFNFIKELPQNVRTLPVNQLFPLAQEQVINAKLIESNLDEKALEKNEIVKRELEQAKANIIRNVFIQQELEKRLTDERLKAAYDEYVKNFPEVEEVSAAHILVDEEEKAKELITKLNDGGDFAELAKENSKDATAGNGGSLGYFAKNDVVPEFGEAAFSTQPGNYTKEPVKSQFGFHVIKVEEKRQRPPAEFEQAREFLSANLRREIMDEMITDWKEGKEIHRFDINGNEIEPASGEAKEN